MSFDYLAYAMPKDLIQSLRSQTEAFINIFYEANYAEEFEEILEEYAEDIEKLGINIAKQLFNHVQFLLENENYTLDLDGEYWASPVHFFLSGEFDDEEILPQPNFIVKKTANKILINALGGTDSIESEEEMILITPPEQIKEITENLTQILPLDFKKRWAELTQETGQYNDAFEEGEDLDEFIADLHEFLQEVLLPFYKILLEKNMGIIVMFN